MGIVLFFLLAVLSAAAILQPLLPGSHSSYPLADAGRPVRAARPMRISADKPGTSCPRCGARTQPGDQFCARCGETLGGPPAVRQCAACGAPLGEGDRFCRKCGANIAPEEVQ